MRDEKALKLKDLERLKSVTLSNIKPIKMSTRWGEEVTIKFVQLYREHECLWNASLPTYKNRDFRTAALQQIIEQMNLPAFTVYDAKQKIKNLRSTYSQELIKMEKCRDQNSDYVPTLKWFNEMHAFLSDIVKQRDRPRQISASQLYVKSPEDEFDESEYSYQLSLDSVAAGASTRGHQDFTKRPQPLRSIKTCNLSDEMSTELQLMHDPLNNPDNEQECEIFGKHVINQLKKLSAEQCILAQEEIQSVLTRCRLNDIRNQVSYNFSQSHDILSSTVKSPSASDPSCHSQTPSS